MEIFTFNGYDGEKIALKLKEVIGFPDSTSYEGGYDIICSLEIDVGCYKAKFDRYYSATGALYMRISTDNGVSWSEAISVKGADRLDGEMSGPASSTDGNFASFDGVDGTTLKDSGKSASSFLESVAGDTTPELGGSLDCNNKLVYWDLYTISGTSIDVANGNKQKLTLSSSNIVVTLETPSGACAFHLFIYQGATARTITWPTIKWLGGTAPDIAVNSGFFVVCLAWDGTSWFGSWGAYS